MYLILSILIALGEHFPKPESEIRFGWGISYNYIGQLYHNLDKYDVVVGLEIPDFRTIAYYTPFSTRADYCERWYDEFVGNTKVLYQTCKNVWPAYLATIKKLEQSRERIKQIMEFEIPAVVPNFKLDDDYQTTTSVYSNIEYGSYIEKKTRKKRFITDLISLGIQGFTAFNTNRKVNQLKKGMKKLFEQQHHLSNKVVKLEDDMISLAHVTMEGLEHLQNELVRQGRHIKNITSRVRRLEIRLTGLQPKVTDNTNAIKFLSSLFGLLLSDLNRYLMLYETILSELDHFLDALDTLSNNQLSHSVIHPKEMNDLIDHVQGVLETTYPNYELIVSKVHDYYNLPFSTFACKDNTLIIHVSFYIKPINQESLYMYDITTIPVPYHMNEELIDDTESKYTYTRIKPSTEVLALGRSSQINLGYHDLVHCIQYNIMFFCEQMFLIKTGNEYTCESAIYTYQNSKLIQQKCDIEYYPELNPEPKVLNAGKYLLLGNFPLPWNYFCSKKDEIPKPIHGSNYVILKKTDLCQCSLTAGSWYIEANIAYCTEESTTKLTLYYTVNMATMIYQFEEKIKTEGITDLTLFTEKIDFDTEEPNLIVEEDSTVLEDTSPAVDFKEVMLDFEAKRFLSKPDLAMSLSEASHWLGGHNSWLTFVGISAIMVILLIPFIMFTMYKYCGVRFQFQKVNSILAKLLLINKTTETIQPAIAHQMTDKMDITFDVLDQRLIQLVLTTMALTFTCYLIMKLILWIYDFFNTKFIHINSTGLSYWKTLTVDKTNIYLHLYDFTTGDSINLYLGTIFGQPEDIICEGQFTLGSIGLDQTPSYDFIDLKWNTVVLSLKDLDLPMINTLQIPKWKKTQVRKMFGSNNSYFRIVAYSPNTGKVRPLTDVYNLQDETLMEIDEQPTCVVQPLEVIVTEPPQNTVTFNEEQISVHSNVSGSVSD